MRLLLLLAALVAARIWPEQAPWILLSAATVLMLKCIEQEERAKIRVRELERELGYVVRSRRTVRELMRSLPLVQKAARLSDRNGE